MTARASGSVLLCLVLCVPAAGGPIGDLLTTQASAFESFDLTAYLSTVAPERRPAERQIFLRSRLLPLTEVRLSASGSRPRPMSGGRIGAEVELTFRLDGQPADNPFVHTLTYIFASADGSWRVDEIIDDPVRPLPWRQGELVVHRTNHFLIYTRPEMRDDLVELAEDAEAGYATLSRHRLPLAPGYVIHFAAGDEFARLSGGLPALGVAVARQQQVDGHYTVDSRTFYINGGLFSERLRRRLTPEARRVTVTHELAHLALAAQSRPFTPPWLKEGAAVYFSGELSFDANRRLVRGGLDHLSLERMTRARVLGQHGLIPTAGQQAVDEYLFSGNIVAYLVENHGQERFLELYRSYAELPPEQVTGAELTVGALRAHLLTRIFESNASEFAVETTAEALKKTYGLTVNELESEVKEWLSLPHR